MKTKIITILISFYTFSLSAQNSINVLNGILEFSNKDSFLKTTQKLSKLNNNEKNKWENKYKGYTSMRSKYQILIHYLTNNSLTLNLPEELQIIKDKIIREYEPNTFDKIIKSDTLSTVVNENGLVIIENEVYKFGNDTVKIFDKSKLKHNNFDEILADHSKFNTVEFSQKIITEFNVNSKEGDSKSCEKEYKDNYRLKGKIYYSYVPYVYQELEIYSKSEQYIWYLLGWYGVTTSSIRVDIAGTVQIYIPGDGTNYLFDGSESLTESNSDRAEISLLWAYGVTYDQIYFLLDGNHSLKNGSYSASCTTHREVDNW